MNQRKKRVFILLCVVCILSWGCSCSTNPLAEGLTEEQENHLVKLSVQHIELIENFDPENFEALQRKHFETLSENMLKPALDNLPNRVNEITDLQMSQTVELDKLSAELSWRQIGPEKITAEVTIVGDRSYTTSDRSQTIPTQYSLPWTITVEEGKIVFRHSGIRTVNL